MISLDPAVKPQDDSRKVLLYLHLMTKLNPLALWLFSCAALVCVMIVVGATTRLTDSGLSITEWKPLMGAIPPLNEAEWERVFALYRQSPEFQKQNFWMELGDFKMIFFWEWFHRLLGRLIGLAYALPLAWFWIKDKIPSNRKIRLLAIFILGGMQGVMGWVMVQSGLIDRPDVSHYRLAAHLGLAFLILALLIWNGLSFLNLPPQKKQKPLFIHTVAALGLFAITALWGAYTAGLDAGLIYGDSFPKMGGAWIPPDLWSLSPAWLNFFENRVAVQFTHRWLAMAMTAMLISLWAHGLSRKQSVAALHGLALMAIIQISLGIATLMSQVWLPLAAMHQAGAVIILILLTACLHRFRERAA